MKNLAVILTVAAITLSGCAKSDPVYVPGAKMLTVRSSADEQQFNLYAAGNKVPLYCDMLDKGDRVGFARDDSGRLEAVAGRQVHPLNERSYEWKPVPSEADLPFSTRNPMDESGRQAATIIVVVAEIVDGIFRAVGR